MTVISTITKIFITESIWAERENKVGVHPLYVQKAWDGTDAHTRLSHTLHLLEAQASSCRRLMCFLLNRKTRPVCTSKAEELHANHLTKDGHFLPKADQLHQDRGDQLGFTQLGSEQSQEKAQCGSHPPSPAHDKMIHNYIFSKPFSFALRSSSHSAHHKSCSRFCSCSPARSFIYMNVSCLIASYEA